MYVIMKGKIKISAYTPSEVHKVKNRSLYLLGITREKYI